MSATETSKSKLGVFSPNRLTPIHRWYPFVEGYSRELIERSLVGAASSDVVMDPFAGSGTTLLAAAEAGHPAFYAEANPFMAWVTRVKTTLTEPLLGDSESVALLREFAKDSITHEVGEYSATPISRVNDVRNYFPGPNMTAIAATQARIAALPERLKSHALLALAAVLVPASNMVRRTDLRRRTAKDPVPTEFRSAFSFKLSEIADDLQAGAPVPFGRVLQVSNDAREYKTPVPIERFITSPPYLNGTNYGRNTKLELLTLGFITSEEDLRPLRRREITAGINNVTREEIGEVPEPARSSYEALLDATYDKRIPIMVAAYFRDIKLVLESMRANANPGATLVFDIGDSRYSGVTIPVHDIIARIAEQIGWELVSQEDLRARRSFDGTALRQVILNFVAR